MKRQMVFPAGFIVGIVFCVVASVAVRYTVGSSPVTLVFGSNGTIKTIDSDTNSPELVSLGYDVLQLIKNSDFATLSELVHPEYGVLFAPYPTINLSSAKCFTASQISRMGNDRTVYVWGSYDGAQDLIEMTSTEYFSRFVYNKEFITASLVGVDYVVKSGNALENITEIFPNIRFVDFHIPGEDKQAEDLSWNSLRLGFEDYNGKLRLTLILHSEWTV